MKRNFIQQELPPGLIDKAIEFFANGEELMALYKGSAIPFEQIPEDVLDKFHSIMVADKVAYAILSKKFDTQHEMLYQYIWCNFGGWNRIPDMLNGELKTEYWNCGNRGTCKFEGTLCQRINAEEKNPTPREFQIMFLIAEGYSRKEIANKLGTSEFTVNTQIQTIERKVHARSHVDVATFTVKNNLRCFVAASKQPSA